MISATGHRIALMAVASGLLGAGLARAEQGARERIDEASDWPDDGWPKDATVGTTGPVTAGVDLGYGELETQALERLREIETRFVLRDEPILLPEMPRDADRPRRGTPARKPVAPRSSYTPHQGARERERRLRKTLQPKEL